MDRVIVILGSGPGIGVGVASHFAEQGFNRVALVARNTERLAIDASRVKSAAEAAKKDVTVKTYSVDVTDVAKFEGVLGNIVQELGKPEVVVYNAVRIGRGSFFKQTEESVNYDFKITTLGLYTTARVLMPHLLSHVGSAGRNPALLVSSGGLYKTPHHALFSLSLSKASQHNMTESLSQRFAGEGVHVASVVVHGLVRPDSPHFSPSKIAEVFWKLYGQGADGETDVWVTDGTDPKL
ncbi:NAD(P)-binding protein [Eremomyces bilateralis CBS 781.70]|uniref:NAD(P)-binding protein n=1 Tax=Eremomyces bilateralis CBS 781.70 TaxID=1392243 RepID=A0A6G1G9W1_9PEZI|nr:NAD(P)-binding protein [Eremomyces bilateralis CBS 781.70]KAF1814867.1 NAD(P)-binding protein [Eremomyces bilateralis CBS 781.70]